MITTTPLIMIWTTTIQGNDTKIVRVYIKFHNKFNISYKNIRIYSYDTRAFIPMDTIIPINSKILIIEKIHQNDINNILINIKTHHNSINNSELYIILSVYRNLFYFQKKLITKEGLINNIFPPEITESVIKKYSVKDNSIWWNQLILYIKIWWLDPELYGGIIGYFLFNYMDIQYFKDIVELKKKTTVNICCSCKDFIYEYNENICGQCKKECILI